MAKGPILPETPVLLLVLVVLEKRSCPASGMNKGRPFPKTSLEFYPDLSAIVQDDEGGGDSVTQPGVLTPRNSRKKGRPERAEDVLGQRWPWPTFHPHIARIRSFCRPYRADHVLGGDPGLKMT
jgi:hypothetical protein